MLNYMKKVQLPELHKLQTLTKNQKKPLLMTQLVKNLSINLKHFQIREMKPTK
jgi:hypothetical protein